MNLTAGNRSFYQYKVVTSSLVILFIVQSLFDFLQNILLQVKQWKYYLH